HWRSSETLDSYLRRHGVPGLQGVDTRALTRRLRTQGTLRGVLAPTATIGPAATELAALIARARALPSLSDQPVVAEVTGSAAAALASATATVAGWTGPRAATLATGPSSTVVVLDCGAKHNIVRSLRARGVEVVVVEAPGELGAMLASRPAGLVLANG